MSTQHHLVILFERHWQENMARIRSILTEPSRGASFGVQRTKILATNLLA